MDKFYNDYRYYPLYLVPRPSRDNPLQLLFSELQGRGLACFYDITRIVSLLFDASSKFVTMSLLEAVQFNCTFLSIVTALGKVRIFCE